MCMAADCGGWDACIMDEDGTGDGEWGKAISVMGTPKVGGGGWEDTATETCTDGLSAGRDGRAGGAESSYEITGPETGRAGRPPYPGMPNYRSGSAEEDGQLLTVAKRMEISPIWHCMP